MRKLTLIASPIAAAVLAVTGSATSEAAASAPHPSATFAFKADRIQHLVKPVLTYKTSHLPRRSVIDLQRQFGTGRVWKNVERLKATKGTVSAPGVQMGKYEYRIRVSKSGRTVVTSATKPLYSYGRVALSAICAAIYGFCGAQTVQIGTTVFTYILNGSAIYPNYSTVLKATPTSCAHAWIQFGTNDSGSGALAYAEIVQSSTDPQTRSVAAGTIGTLSAKLDGGPFYVDLSETNDDSVYVNGYASCYTPSGLR
jgi:hypothetical protein